MSAHTPAFRIVALPAEPFAPLFELDDGALAARGIRRCTADHPLAYPCRVSLQNAAVGEEVLLLPFEHHATASPYRASGPIFVRRGAVRADFAVDEVPPQFRRKRLSVRAYNHDGDLVRADVVTGDALESCVSGMLEVSEVDCLHLHHAGHGCYLCRVERADRVSAEAAPA
ncbi:DUF1203 domain-containing protein [Marilutibacter chinensis]|uniref:DUF1203 domain-containing protein n=1 Tax=Marilutibacter chinensis TaxID=2912247 RepID=A0ABS9HZ49_9GAMM|nr:DUF1203 domain-containing protein [Lysobacter chinensis]MCF7223457.1 DUF1203 domain-containing protein [Lysobacter chinensis]